MTQPGFPDLGSLYNKGLVNGILVWTQPDGPGTKVFPQFPRYYPERPQGFPQQPFAYQGFLNFGCGHWANTVEVYEIWNPYDEVRSALCCCPMCSYIQLIVQPADDWWNSFYSIYATGQESHNNIVQ